MQYLHLKTKARLLTGAFVCKNQVDVWNSVLCEQFYEQAVICTCKNGLRWATFSPENVVQLFFYYYISGKLTQIYPEKQQDDSTKENYWKHMEEGDLGCRIGIVHWMNLPNTPILWTTPKTNCIILSQEICFRASQYYKCSLLVHGWRHDFISNLTYGFCKTWRDQSR